MIEQDLHEQRLETLRRRALRGDHPDRLVLNRGCRPADLCQLQATPGGGNRAPVRPVSAPGGPEAVPGTAGGSPAGAGKALVSGSLPMVFSRFGWLD